MLKKNNKTKTLQKLIVLINVLNCWISWLKNIRDVYGCGVSVSLTHLDDFDSCFTKKKKIVLVSSVTLVKPGVVDSFLNGS